MNVADLFSEFHDPPIMLYPIHKRLTGRATTAILFSYVCRQLGYYRKDKIFATDSEVAADTGLTPDELRGAKTCLKATGLINITREGSDGRTHYAVNVPILREKLKKLSPRFGEIAPTGLGNLPKPVSGKSPDPLREHTEENNNTMSPQAGTARDPVHPRWQRYAQTLGDTIALSRKVKHSPAQIRAWAKWISKLESVKGIEPKRIKAILKWYCANLPANLDNRYYPVVRCGESFFTKFDKLEDAKHRMELEVAEAKGESKEEQGPDIISVVREDDGSPINFD